MMSVIQITKSPNHLDCRQVDGYASRMSLEPETCAYCASTMTMTQQAFEKKLIPPEAIRNGLLLGVILGEHGGENPACDYCRGYLESVRAQAAEFQEMQQKLEAEPGNATQDAAAPDVIP